MGRIFFESGALCLDMPAVYRFSINGADFSSEASAAWTHWGWCMPEEMVELINKNYGFHWSLRELIARFAYKAEDLEGTNNKPLLFLKVDLESYCFEAQKYDKFARLFSPKYKFLFPAGWAKNVLWALRNGCTHFKVVDNPAGRKPVRGLSACSEDGRAHYYA